MTSKGAALFAVVWFVSVVASLNMRYGYDAKGNPMHWYEIDAAPAWKPQQVRDAWEKLTWETISRSRIRRITDTWHHDMEVIRRPMIT
jgi:hypothetical protein